MNEFNKIFGNSFFLKEELKKENQNEKTLQELMGGSLKTTLVFAWKGIASDYKLYSEHLKESFRERDEDVRSKIWAN